MRKTEFANGEFYHIYNRGVDKRNITSGEKDIERFFQSVREFNVIEPIGSLYEQSFLKEKTSKKSKKLVDFICYCLNPNHYHFLLQQVTDKGIEKFMHRFGTGYTKYFNNKHRRSGVLFQGKFKAIHIGSNEYLLHVSAYINLNDRVHQLGSSASKLVRSSWHEYANSSQEDIKFCTTDVILEQFKNKKEYGDFAHSSLGDILERRGREEEKDLRTLLLE